MFSNVYKYGTPDLLNGTVRYAVKKKRCGSRPVGPDPHVWLRPGTVKIRESGTASNYGSGIKDRTRISCRTGTRPDFVFLAHKNLPNDRIWVQSSDPDLPGLIRFHPIIVCEPARRKRWLLDPDRFGCLTTVTKKRISGQLFLREREEIGKTRKFKIRAIQIVLLRPNCYKRTCN